MWLRADEIRFASLAVFWRLAFMIVHRIVYKNTPLEKCSEAEGVSWDQLRTVQACLSYLHTLTTGSDSSNHKEVKEVWEGLKSVGKIH